MPKVDEAVRFTGDEIAAIRKFFGWITEGEWLGRREGITGVNDEGVQIVEFEAVDDYGGCGIETAETFIPWIALTDPDEYQRQCDEAKAAEEREAEAHEAAYRRQVEAQERATYEALKAKYEGSRGADG